MMDAALHQLSSSGSGGMRQLATLSPLLSAVLSCSVPHPLLGVELIEAARGDSQQPLQPEQIQQQDQQAHAAGDAAAHATHTMAQHHRWQQQHHHHHDHQQLQRQVHVPPSGWHAAGSLLPAMLRVAPGARAGPAVVPPLSRGLRAATKAAPPRQDDEEFALLASECGRVECAPHTVLAARTRPHARTSIKQRSRNASGRARAGELFRSGEVLTPTAIVQALDRYIVGQVRPPFLPPLLLMSCRLDVSH